MYQSRRRLTLGIFCVGSLTMALTTAFASSASAAPLQTVELPVLGTGLTITITIDETGNIQSVGYDGNFDSAGDEISVDATTLSVHSDDGDVEVDEVDDSNVEVDEVDDSNVEVDDVDDSNVDDSNVDDSNVDESNVDESNVDNSDDNSVDNSDEASDD